MSAGYHEHSPRVREPEQRHRLLKRTHRADASVERLPELLPCICPDCGAVLGLVAVGQALRCVDCAIWVEPADDLAAS